MTSLRKLFLCLVLNACAFGCADSSEEPTPITPTQLNRWQSAALEIEQIATEMEAIARNTHPNGSSFLACATAQNELTPEGLETTFTFSGATPCTDGKTRSGTITMLTGNSTNFEAFLHLDNYRVNGSKIEGSFMFERVQVAGKNAVLHLISSNGRVLPASGDNFGFSINRYSHLKEGHGTFYDTSDDVVEAYEAEYSCIRTNGAFTASITAPVLVKNTCPIAASVKPVQGKISLELTTGQKHILNLGDGTCTAQPSAG